MINLNGMRLCENCFEEMKVGAKFCTHCGYNPTESASDPTMLTPGSVLLGKYIVGKVMGKGGFGITYLAYNVNTGKKVAIKEFFPYGIALRASGTTTVSVSSMDNADAFKLGAEKFYNEAKLVSKFNGNPNIVGVYEFFYENDTVYFAMEYLQGHTLKEHIQANGPLNPAQAVFIAQNIANALMAAHSSSVLHRDISPDNIIICDNGNVKLIDFGAARQVVAEHSQSFSVILKPGFAPLEQYQKKGNQGPWTDIYSLGATIYYALTEDILEDPMSRLDDDDEFKSNQYNIDPELWSVISKATELKIDDRYADIFQFKNDLSKVSVEAEPLVVPKEESTEKMPEFQTALPFGMTQNSTSQPKGQPVGGGAPVLAPSSAPIGAVMSGSSNAEAVQAAPKIKSDLSKSLSPKMIAIAISAAVLIAAAVVIIVTNALSSNQNNNDSASGYSATSSSTASKPTNDSTGSSNNEITQVTNKDYGNGKYSGEWQEALGGGWPQGHGNFTRKDDDGSFFYQSGTYDGGNLSEGESLTIYSDHSSYDFTSTGYNEIRTSERVLYYLGSYPPDSSKDTEYISVDLEKGLFLLCVGILDSEGNMLDGYQILFSRSPLSDSIELSGYYKITNGNRETISENEAAKISELKKYTSEYVSDAISNHYGYKDKFVQTITDASTSGAPSLKYSSPLDNNNSSGTGAASNSSAEKDVEAANSIAKSIKNSINDRWEFAMIKGYGMKYPTKAIFDRLEISVDESGNWSVSGIEPDHFTTDGYYTWSASASGVNGDTEYSYDATVNFLIALAHEYPDMKDAAIYAVLKSGDGCIFAAYTSDTSSANKLAREVEDMVSVSGDVAKSDSWDGKTAGVTSSGLIVGTKPVVGLK